MCDTLCRNSNQVVGFQRAVMEAGWMPAPSSGVRRHLAADGWLRAGHSAVLMSHGGIGLKEDKCRPLSL